MGMVLVVKQKIKRNLVEQLFLASPGGVAWPLAYSFCKRFSTTRHVGIAPIILEASQEHWGLKDCTSIAVSALSA